MYGPNPENEWSEKYQTPTSKNQARRALLRFAGYCHKTPTELLDLQAKGMTSQDPDQQYVVLDLLQKWIESLKGRRSSKIGRLSTVRQFFEYHHRPLPPTSKNWLRGIKSDVPAVEGKLNVDRLRALVASVVGDPRKLSMVLAQLQSFSGPRELCLIGNTMGVGIGEQIRSGANLVEVYFPFGRKHSDKSWYSYLGKDACESLRKWFAIRGYPTKESPLIWPCRSNGDLGPLTETNLAGLFQDMMVRLGFREKMGVRKGKAVRYGVSVKELRDLAASIAQTCVGRTNEENEVFLESSIEYFLGDAVDPMHYRKMHELSPEFRKRQYVMVEPYLKILTNAKGAVASKLEETSKELAELRERFESYEDVAKQLRELRDEGQKELWTKRQPVVELVESKARMELVKPKKKRRRL
jgi:hypothetical protein